MVPGSLLIHVISKAGRAAEVGVPAYTGAIQVLYPGNLVTGIFRDRPEPTPLMLPSGLHPSPRNPRHRTDLGVQNPPGSLSHIPIMLSSVILGANFCHSLSILGPISLLTCCHSLSVHSAGRGTQFLDEGGMLAWRGHPFVKLTDG